MKQHRYLNTRLDRLARRMAEQGLRQHWEATEAHENRLRTRTYGAELRLEDVHLDPALSDKWSPVWLLYGVLSALAGGLWVAEIVWSFQPNAKAVFLIH